jgi:hypothetical protein
MRLFCCYCIIIMITMTSALTIVMPRPSAHICIVTSKREKTQYVQDTAAAILGQLHGSDLQFSMSIIIADRGGSGMDGTLLQGYARHLQPRRMTSGADCDTNADTDPLPPCRVRQQGLDVAGALEMCHAERPDASWIVLLEDDFAPCYGNTLHELGRALLAQAGETVKFVRFTQGGGGVAFPRHSVPPYVRYVREHSREVPHDRALMLPWSTKRDVVLPTHLFRHVGSVSTIAYRNTETYARQYASIRDNECGSAIAV